MNKCVRTYSRRRGEDTRIEGVDKLCRLCLTECENSIPIFVDKGGDTEDVCAALALRIMMCVGYEVSNTECLPNKICLECNNELERIYVFKKKCESSYQKLKSHLAAVNKVRVTREKECEPTTVERIDAANQSLEEGSKEKNEFNVIFVVGADGTIKFESSIEKEGSNLKETICLIEKTEVIQSNNTLIKNPNSLLKQNVENENNFQKGSNLQETICLIENPEVIQSKNTLLNNPNSLLIQNVENANNFHKESNLQEAICLIENTQEIQSNNILIKNPNSLLIQNVENANNFRDECNLQETICLIENSEEHQSNNIFIKNPNSLLIQNVENVKKIEEIQERNDIDDKTTSTDESIKMETATVEETEIVVSSESNDMSSILSNLLIDAGVLSYSDLQYSVRDEKVELETEDGSVVTLEFFEESDDEHTNMPLQFNIDNNESDKMPTVEHVNPKQKKLDLKGPAPGKCWCNECGRSLANRSALARHSLAIHARLKPHQCEHCDRTFAQKAVLRRHMLVHQEERPYQCTECPKGFTQRGALEQHSRAHRKTLALHHCPVCKKVFLYASGLSRHMITHSSVGFSCGGCTRQFNDKSSLRRHMKNTNHPPDPNT